jgi:transcriptional regulator with XRE-family HTH domain
VCCMTDNESIPGQWTPHLLRWQQRTGVELTYRAMARELNMDHMTLWRLLNGKGRSSAGKVEQLASVLGVTPAKVRELRGVAPDEPFDLPPEASVLTSGQRAAVLAVVRQFIATHSEGDGEQASEPASGVGKVRALRPEDQWQHEFDLAARRNPDPKDDDLRGLDEGED